MSFPPTISARPATHPAPRAPGKGAAVNLALDNMLRNQLKVRDPGNAREVAEGLLAFYQGTPQADGIVQEAQGLPFLQSRAVAAPPRQASSSDTEFGIANGDVEKALQDLANNPLTNDFTPEMQGWGDSIRSAIVQGHAAAMQGIDPSQRDKVMAVRRQLGEYARMARGVGSLSPGMTQNYRRLGRGLDEVSAVLLVVLGESLASVGFATGYYLLQVPLQELQQRRDAVIYALRNFNGGAQQAYGPDDWPRGIDAYRRLYKWLEEQGQGDLRSLLLENEVAQTMDTLISRAQNGTPEGLRALGVTAQLDIERFRRMAIVAPGAMSRLGGGYDRSPPLEAFLQALDLFAETFRPAGGLRLLRIARPAILLYGLYNVTQLPHDNALFELISVRGTLATIFDGLFPSNSARGVQPQMLLDMLLLELDRGIDLLALESGGSESSGAPAGRAIAFWAIIRVIRNLTSGAYITASLLPPGPPPPPLPPAALQPTSVQGPIYVAMNTPNPGHAMEKIQNDIVRIYQDYSNSTQSVPGLKGAFDRYDAINLTKAGIHAKNKRSVEEELNVQRTLEDRWEKLMFTVALEAGDQASIFELLKMVIGQAAYDLAVIDDTPEALPLPPQFEQSLQKLVWK